jgi:hypothetical protein
MQMEARMAKGTNRVARVLAAVVVLVGSAALFMSPDYWGRIDEPLVWIILIIQLATSIGVIATLAREEKRWGRTLGIGLATGLLVATLFGAGALQALMEMRWFGIKASVAHLVDLTNVADLLAFCLALGLVAVLAVTRRRKLLWLGMAALWGGLMLVVRLVGLAISFMN